MNYKTRTTRTTVLPEGERIYSERATHVEISDEAGGEFVVLRQTEGEIRIDPQEWPCLRGAIDDAFDRCEEFSPPQRGAEVMENNNPQE